MKRAAVALVVACVGALSSGAALAQSSGTRSTSFAYDAASGLLTQEVVEPNTSSLRLETDYSYDAFGNKTSATVSGVDITSRAANTTYDANGQFITSASNALGQSESWQYDPRFGKPTSHTGPNGLTTTWSYDGFGRKVTEVRADGTQTSWAYQYCSGTNGGTASCPSGAAYLTQATPLASDGATQNGPIGIVYFDSLDREVGRDTQGFDGSIIRGSKQYDALGRISQTSRPYFLNGGTPQFTTFTYDVLGRGLSVTTPDGGVTQTAYHGLSFTDTNALNQTRTVTKNSQGQVVSVTDALGQTMLYAYDAFGNLIQTTDAQTNIVTATYDVRGRKVSSSDPDLGPRSYAYDTLGELKSQTDAKGQVTTLTYDLLSRPLQRVEADMTCVWVYDTATNGIGKLTSSSITAGSNSGYQRGFAYDALGRPTQISTTVGGNAYLMSAAYDANSRLSQVTYPSGFSAAFTYNNLGYASQLSDGAAQTFWTLNSMDAEQHVTLQTSGNGVATTRGFSATTGRLISVTAGSNNAVQNLSFTYDLLGNPTNRTDNTSNLSESFTYDPLNRLLSATVSTDVAPVKNIAYNAIGNILSKSDLGTYAYAAPGAPLPHAVTSISGTTLSTTFTYDPNGNQLTGLNRNISWTSFNMPASITQGTNTISFQYDVNHQRVIQIAPDGTTTIYINAFGVSTELFAAGTAAARWTDYLSVGNAKVGMRITNIAAATISTRYFHTDHLGSIAVITDENANVVERLSYDAWGKRRFPNGADDPSGSITSQSPRGFTGEEQLDTVGLVHLNGRVYDPLVGRMISADPTVPDALNPQTWNRYSYVGNDPLAFTDPSGFNFFSDFFHSIGNFFSSIFNFFRENFRAILQIAVTAALNAILPFSGVLLAVAAAAGGAAIATGLTGGNLSQVLRASVIAGATAFAFFQVGELTNTLPGANPDPITGAHGTPTFGTEAYAFNVAGHALVGCGAAVASGGKCAAGALAAGSGAAIGPALTGLSFGARLTVTSVVGGLASVAGGGKFANGALTAAFGYLFNQVAQGVERYPFQQGFESLGFSGRAPDIIGGYGNALLNFLGVASLFVQPELAPIAADAIVLGRFPAYVDLADQLGAKAFNLGTDGWAALGNDAARWGANQAFLDGAIANGDRILFASDPFSAANAGSFFEREVNYLQSRGFTITPKEALYPIK